ncbi:MAG: hypothetical protein WKF35_11630 [Ferruginibacter sp.]
MKSYRPLVPGFIQKLDEKLLRNKPVTWSARTHLVIYFASIFIFLLALLCFFSFTEAKSFSNIETWAGFTALISFIGFIIWLIFLLRFNVFKRFGRWFEWDGLKTFGLYFINISLMVGATFVPAAIESFNANKQFSNEEIVKDINELNVNAVKLEYNQLPLEWKADTFLLRDKMPSYEVPVDNPESVTIARSGNSRYYYMDTVIMRDKLAGADSVIRLSDSLYVFYKCPEYTFTTSYNADAYTPLKQLTSKDIYYREIRNFKPVDRQPLIDRMNQLKEKYAVKRYYESESYTDMQDKTYDFKIRSKYSLISINNGIENIVRKKYRWKESTGWQFRFFFYTTLFFTLLVFIFRHTTARTFFLSLLSVVILMILTALFGVIFNYRETGLFSLMLFYYIVLAIITLTIKWAKKRNVIQGIALNIVLFFTPFLPLFLTAMYFEFRRVNSYADPDYSTYQDTYPWYLGAEIGGFILFLILLQPVFRRLYRKWYALPED